MSLLDKIFDDLLAKLGTPDNLNPARSDPIFYFVYPSNEMLRLKEALPRWSARLRERGLMPVRCSLSDLLWQIVDESGRWEDWLECEAEADPAQINDSVRDVLRSDNRLIDKVTEVITTAPANSIVLLTELEMLHPFFRTRPIEARLHNKVPVPTVLFYPGRRSGQYGLHYLGFYDVDGGYRATLVGGE